MAVRNLADLVRDRIGADAYLDDSRGPATLGTTVAQVLRQSPYRAWAFIVNLSANNVFVGPFVDVSSTKGILLGPGGGNVILDYREDMNLVGYEWNGVAAVAASAILVLELLLQREP